MARRSAPLPDADDGDAPAARQAGPRAGPGGYAALQGVGRAMTIIEAVADRPMRAKELAGRLGLKWTTAYRTLAYLEEHGYLRVDPATAVYSVGPHLYRLGSAYLNSHLLVQAAPPHLKPAGEEMRCAVQLNERQGLRVMTLMYVDAPTSIAKTQPGFSWPLNVASKGHLMLAHAPQSVRGRVLASPLRSFTGHTIVDPGRLAARIEEVRAAGYAVTRDDLQLGVGSVASPVRDARGEVVACVSLIVRSARMNDAAAVERLVAATSEASTSLSLAIGWRPDH